MAKYKSKLGIKPICSTKDPDGDPATLGEPAAKILRDNFQIVEEQLEKKADSGGSTSTLKKVEDSLAVIDKNVANLDTNKTDKKNFVNISQLKNKFDYADRVTGRNAVPQELKALGQVIVFKLSTGDWIVQQFTGNNLTDWSNAAYWEDFGSSSRVFDGGRADSKYGGARSIDCGNAQG